MMSLVKLMFMLNMLNNVIDNVSSARNSARYNFFILPHIIHKEYCLPHTETQRILLDNTRYHLAIIKTFKLATLRAYHYMVTNAVVKHH